MAERVILGVTGSIAAYKAAELVRLMMLEEWDVSVVMTRAATEFVRPLTFRTLSRNPVYVEMFEDTEDWRPEHISLAEKTDVVVVAPCTANVLAKAAHGIADDLLTCVLLATDAPVVMAPAMNEKMWENPATQANVNSLVGCGIHIVDVGSGDLACGYQGKGRMAALDDIMTMVKSCLKRDASASSA